MLLVVSFCIALGSWVEFFSGSAGISKQQNFVEPSHFPKREMTFFASWVKLIASINKTSQVVRGFGLYAFDNVYHTLNMLSFYSRTLERKKIPGYLGTDMNDMNPMPRDLPVVTQEPCGGMCVDLSPTTAQLIFNLCSSLLSPTPHQTPTLASRLLKIF